jgi:hypothetical protein
MEGNVQFTGIDKGAAGVEKYVLLKGKQKNSDEIKFSLSTCRLKCLTLKIY